METSKIARESHKQLVDIKEQSYLIVSSTFVKIYFHKASMGDLLTMIKFDEVFINKYIVKNGPLYKCP